MFYYSTYVFNYFPSELSNLIYTFIKHPLTQARDDIFISIKDNEKNVSDDIILVFKEAKMSQMMFPSMDYAHMTTDERLDFDSYYSQIDKLYNEEMKYRDYMSSETVQITMPRHCNKLSRIIKDRDEYFYTHPLYYHANEKILYIINNNLWY